MHSPIPKQPPVTGKTAMYTGLRDSTIRKCQRRLFAVLVAAGTVIYGTLYSLSTKRISHFGHVPIFVEPSNGHLPNLPLFVPPALQTPAASLDVPTKHAYAFLLAGCDPAKPAYMGFVYNILVASYILRESGSTSDIIVIVRMATKSDDTALPSDVENLLQLSGVIVRYVPKVKVDNFYTAMMEKFYILELVEYSRVLFLDSDVMPLCNLDYMFHLSEGNDAVLRENVILQTGLAPANGGFFMLKPNHDDYLQNLEIQKERLKQGYHFDVVNGWGHAIQPPDEWVAKGGYPRGTNWTFYGALADQGLLYHWVKYVKKNVSIVFLDKVETWTDAEDVSNVQKQLVNVSYDVFGDGCSSSSLPHFQVNLNRSQFPYDDFVHFMAGEKPWMKGKAPPANETLTVFQSGHDLWYHVLRQAKKRYNMTLNVDELKLRPPTLGLFPAHIMVENVKQAELTA